MAKRLTRTGNSLALVLDKPLLDALRIDANTPLEVSTDGEVIIVSPVRDRRRTARRKKVGAEAQGASPENRVPRIRLTLGR